MKEKILIYIMILILISGSIFSVDYYVLTNTEAKAYIKPDLNSDKIDYNFENGELLSVYDITNNWRNDWLFVNMVKNQKGWMLKVNTYDVKDLPDSKLYYEIFNREILSNYQNINIDFKIVDIKFFEYPEKHYYGMQYLMKAEDGWSTGSFLYRLSNDILNRSLAIGGINRTYYFLSNYIISFSKDGVSVYSSMLFEKDNEKRINPSGKLYKKVFTKLLIPQNQHKAYDSYAEFDETNRIMTEYLREDPQKPFKVIKYSFQEGKFVPINGTN